MSTRYEPHELSQVEFKDDDDAVEEGQLQVDFADKDALLDQLDLPMVTPTRRRAGRPWFKIMCVLVPILGAIGTGLYFILAPSTSDSSSSSTSSSAAYLVEPPANIASKCSTDSDECRMVCEPAECCTFPSNLELSCLAGNEDKCLVYHQYCSILDGGEQLVKSEEQIPRAPTNLDTVCTTDKIATVDGFQECQEACQPASCCYDDSRDVDTCSNEECADYAPCLILSASDNIHKEIPVHVADQCDHLEDITSRSACRVACSHALCCFYKDKNSCPQPDTSFCEQYSVCNDLEVDVNVVADSAEVTSICNSYHTSMCEVVCERGACCFASGGCPSSDINCADYMTCANIYGDTPDDDKSGVEEGSVTGGTEQQQGGTDNDNDDSTGGVVFKADVDDACVDLDPAKDSSTDSKCAKLCANAECCFTQSGCNTEINCGVYKECDVIYATLVQEASNGGSGGSNGSKTDGDGDDNLGIVFKVDVDDACVRTILVLMVRTKHCAQSSVPTLLAASMRMDVLPISIVTRTQNVMCSFKTTAAVLLLV
ncbi:hypothetical protein MHU86_23748 [Fragilaria crotonensis]|nr:hypothetical protein MHU86_23748 [Fragilaria crotonensis]